MYMAFSIPEILYEVTKNMSFESIRRMEKSGISFHSPYILEMIRKRFNLRKSESLNKMAILYYRRHISLKSVKSFDPSDLLVISCSRKCPSVVSACLRNGASGIANCIDIVFDNGDKKVQKIVLSEVKESFRELVSLSKKEKCDYHSVERASYLLSRSLERKKPSSERVIILRNKILKDTYKTFASCRRRDIPDYPQNERMAFVYDRLFGGACGDRFRILSGLSPRGRLSKRNISLLFDVRED